MMLPKPSPDLTQSGERRIVATPDPVHPLAREAVKRVGTHPIHRDHRRGITERKNVTSDLDPLAAYPAVSQDSLAQAYLANLEEMYGALGLGASEVLFTRGSIEGLDLLVRAFCEAGEDYVAVTPPTFPGYERLAVSSDVGVIRVPLEGNMFERLDVSRVLSEPSKLLFLSNPNDQVGSVLENAAIRELVERFEGLVVVDEGYAELAAAPFTSALGLVKDHENVVVVRTLSKGWALAGLRIGAVVANARVLNALRRIYDPFSINTVTRSLLLERLLDPSRTKQNIAVVRERREVLSARLEQLPAVVRMIPSHASFILVQVEPFAEVLHELEARGCLVTSVDPHVRHAIKVTVGSPTENERVLEVIDRQGASRASRRHG